MPITLRNLLKKLGLPEMLLFFSNVRYTLFSIHGLMLQLSISLISVTYLIFRHALFESKPSLPFAFRVPERYFAMQQIKIKRLQQRNLKLYVILFCLNFLKRDYKETKYQCMYKVQFKFYKGLEEVINDYTEEWSQSNVNLTFQNMQ